MTLAILLALAARSIDMGLRRARNSENAVTEQKFAVFMPKIARTPLRAENGTAAATKENPPVPFLGKVL